MLQTNGAAAWTSLMERKDVKRSSLSRPTDSVEDASSTRLRSPEARYNKLLRLTRRLLEHQCLQERMLTSSASPQPVKAKS